jgi:AraC-like DNA-binding protein
MVTLPLRDERLTGAAVASRVGYTSDVAFAATYRRLFGVPRPSGDATSRLHRAALPPGE